MLESLIQELAVIGLHLNAAKTKIFTTDEDAPDMIEVADSFISVLSDLDSHKYLGRKLPGNLNNRSSVEIAHRIQIAWMKFHQHKDVLIDKNVCIRSRLRFFDAIISPTILFGLGICALTQQQINQLDRVQRRMLRAIVGWVRHNDELWENTMRRMRDRIFNALSIYNVTPWGQQMAANKFKMVSRFMIMHQT